MKSFAVFIVLVAVIANVQGIDVEKTNDGTKIRQNDQPQMRQMNAMEQMQMRQQMGKAEQSGGDMLASAYGKPAPTAAYGANYNSAAYPSVPAPPCPRNYLFSCQPNLTPTPCAQQAAGYGSAGAYSHYMPQYALPAPLQY